jgi:mono/diheme cytochrome c family protein
MNAQHSPTGAPPPPGDDVYKDLQIYMHWLASGAPTGVDLEGAGYPELEKTAAGYDPARGSRVYAANCATCHGADGQGQYDLNGRPVFPALWGPRSYNWGAGMARVNTAAGFIKANMPLGQTDRLTDQQAWDVAAFINSQERPKDPRQTGTVQETAFMTGNGAGQPLGVFTASASGINTGRDVSTDNTDTAITADGLINAKYGLSSPWLGSTNLRWVMHRDTVKMIRKLKDGEGQYLWVPGLVANRPDVILNTPVLISEYAPNTFTSGLYVGLIGDLRYYWIAENMSMEIQRLQELGALTNQDYFIGRMALDGMPVLEEAFIRVKLA